VFASFVSLPNGVDDLILCLLLYFPCTWMPTGSQMMTPTRMLTTQMMQPCTVCVFITAVPNTKLCAWGEKDSGGHVI
jgi:hypothetical protein